MDEPEVRRESAEKRREAFPLGLSERATRDLILHVASAHLVGTLVGTLGAIAGAPARPARLGRRRSTRPALRSVRPVMAPIDECSIAPLFSQAHILPNVAVCAPVSKLPAAVIREGTDPRAPLRRRAGGFLGAWRAHHAEAAARGATISDHLVIGSPAARLPSARSAEADVSITTPRTPAGRGRVAPPLDLCSFHDLAASFTAAADRPARSPVDDALPAQSCTMTAAAERRAIAEGIASAHARARSA